MIAHNQLIACPELLRTANWKGQFAGTKFPLLSAHASAINRSIGLPRTLKRLKGRPKSTKRNRCL
jgi:hypothetical protein